jgi:hypothetical protein
MNLLWIALISSIPAGISILLFLLRNKILSPQTENEEAGTIESGHDDGRNSKNEPRLAKVIQPQERSHSVPASAQPDRRFSEKELNANGKAAKKFTKGFYSEAIEIVKRSLERGDLRWRTLLDALEAEALDCKLPGAALTTDIYTTWLYKKEAKDIETASRLLVFGTWYTTIMKNKKPNSTAISNVNIAIADTLEKMGKTYASLPELLNRPGADFQSDAQKCFNEAYKIRSSLKNEKGEAEMRNP